jgi:hypothetical protein
MKSNQRCRGWSRAPWYPVRSTANPTRQKYRKFGISMKIMLRCRINFFNKTHRNIRANPFAFAIIRDPEKFQEWHVELHFDHSESDGELFDEMDMKLEAIASMTGMSDIF